MEEIVLHGTFREKVRIVKYPTYTEWTVESFGPFAADAVKFYTDIHIDAPEDIKKSSEYSMIDFLSPNTLIFAGGHPLRIVKISFSNLFEALGLYKEFNSIEDIRLY